MDVSEEILQNHLIYGASDNTHPAGIVASRSLNYAEGASIQRPDKLSVSLIPYTLKYQGTVGLFGTENYFVKIQVNLDSSVVASCYEEPYWECAVIYAKEDTDPYYLEAILDREKDLTTVNTYEPAYINLSMNTRFDSYLAVSVNNLKTGNQYMDDWLDIRLYTANREEHPYDTMYIKEKSFFYVGFHARNTRRLDYNVEVIVGGTYISYDAMTDDQRKQISRVN